MTTFIDFRYSAAQASALRQDYVECEETLGLSASGDNYIVFEISKTAAPGTLVTVGELGLDLDNDRTLYLRQGDVSVSTATPIGVGEADLVCIRFSKELIGIKYQGLIYESTVKANTALTSYEVILAPQVRIVGRNTGRAVPWAKLFYHRTTPKGLCVEVVMDWQNIQSGIPTNAVATVEELLSQSDFSIKLTSYACDQEEAKKSDFSRLFSTSDAPQVTLHIAPPLYTRANPSTVNIGLFVVESEEVASSIIRRCNEMDLLLVPTRFVEKALRKSGATPPIHVIPHGVDLEFYKPVAAKTHLKSGKTFNILSICAYSERKNVYYFSRAFMEEFGIEEDIALHLYVRPEYLTTQNNLLQEFTEWENWHFNESGLILMSTSYVSRAHLRDLYANADIYLMPSVEGFGFTLLEAMASGTPAIGLGYGGQLDFLNSETGYVAPKGKRYTCKNMDLLPYVGESFYAPDIKKLRKILRHAFNNRKEVAALGRSARRYVESRFSWSEVGKEIVSLIRKSHRDYSNEKNLAVSPSEYSPVTWMIGVIDETSLDPALSALAGEIEEGVEAICLFTRYGEIRDALKAKKKGLLLYRWDTTPENFRTLAVQLVKSPWVGLVYADEAINGDLASLRSFLAEQPGDVTEVKMKTKSGVESRLFKIGKHLSLENLGGSGRVVEFDGLNFS